MTTPNTKVADLEYLTTKRDAYLRMFAQFMKMNMSIEDIKQRCIHTIKQELLVLKKGWTRWPETDSYDQLISCLLILEKVNILEIVEMTLEQKLTWLYLFGENNI